MLQISLFKADYDVALVMVVEPGDQLNLELKSTFISTGVSIGEL